ncbi:MAG: type II toxin-antitoxin system PemK/MazF family toxin [Rhodospirillaceae bacterium]|nr:type II toxin-antitoxin system PemK/MazF family toxin [Rhodospirillaceae bacterium]
MAITAHPDLGTVLICDFTTGFTVPEMVKRRPVVVISPKVRARHGLCTVVSLSTTAPNPIMPYHCQIDLLPRLPPPFRNDGVWVKGDMINAVGFHRLDFVRLGKRPDGRRIYLYDPLNDDTIKRIRECVLRAIGLASLTKGL